MLELSLKTSFTTCCAREICYGTSSAATLLADYINSTSLLEIRDNDIISGSAFKNISAVNESTAQR